MEQMFPRHLSLQKLRFQKAVLKNLACKFKGMLNKEPLYSHLCKAKLPETNCWMILLWLIPPHVTTVVSSPLSFLKNYFHFHCPYNHTQGAWIGQGVTLGQVCNDICKYVLFWNRYTFIGSYENDTYIPWVSFTQLSPVVTSYATKVQYQDPEVHVGIMLLNSLQTFFHAPMCVHVCVVLCNFIYD